MWRLSAPSKEEPMTPNPMVAMAAPAPETRYAPREMPRVSSRKEGQSFEARLNMAEARPKSGSKPGRAAENKPADAREKLEASKEKPAAAAEKPPEASGETAAGTPQGSETPAAPVLPQAEQTPETAVLPAPAQAVPVSELSSFTLMTAATAPAEPAAAPPTDAPDAAPSAGAPTAVTPETAAKDPALNAAIAQVVTPQAKPEAAAKTEEKTSPPLDAEEPEAAETPEPTKSAVPVKPVARQAVPSSLDGLHAVKGLTSLKESLDGAPRTETRAAAARNDAQATPATLDEVTASIVESTDDESPAVKPWEIAEPVRAAAAPSAPKTEVPAIKAEPQPVKEAIVRTFVQVQKTPDRPAELRLQLNPEHLGRMDVRVQAHEGTVSAVIRVEHGAVRDMVESQLAALRTTLADQGIKVDRLEVSVNQQGPRDQQAMSGFDFGRQGFGQEGQRDPSGHETPGNAPHTGWDGWNLDETPEAPTAVEAASSGFDAQA
jgi:flagellar hook-length control protein FliK